jgi:hypothetical protein
MIRSRARDLNELFWSLLREDVLVYQLARERASRPEPPFALKTLSAADALPVPLPYTQTDCATYFKGGWRLSVLLNGSSPVSFAWVRVAAHHNVREVRARVVVQPEAGWIVHCETPEAHRGKGYYPLLISGIAAACAADRCYIYCVAANLASRRGIEKAGFERIGTIRRRFGRMSTDSAFALVTSRISFS